MSKNNYLDMDIRYSKKYLERNKWFFKGSRYKKHTLTSVEVLFMRLMFWKWKEVSKGLFVKKYPSLQTEENV